MQKTVELIEGEEKQSSQKSELIALFRTMLVKSYIDRDDYLQANITISGTVSLEAIMMVFESYS